MGTSRQIKYFKALRKYNKTDFGGVLEHAGADPRVLVDLLEPCYEISNC